VELNDDQADAVERIAAWYRSGSTEAFVLGGYAGTGKTTVTARLPELLGLDPREVLFLTPTNQATRVLRRKLAAPSDTGTVFGYLYVGLPTHCERCPAHAHNAARIMTDRPEDDEGLPECHVSLRDDGCCRLDRSARAEVPHYPLVVVDEASMLQADDHAALRAHGVRLLLVGDPGQLPPVRSDYSAVDHPDHVLTRIMRQGEGSEILAYAAAMRQGLPLPPMLDPALGEVRRLDPSAPVPWHWTENGATVGLDAVVVQSNALRRRLNASARAARDTDPDGPPTAGDLVQANRRLNEGQIYNGMTLTVAEVERGGRALVLRSNDDGYCHRVWLGDQRVDQEGCGLNYGYAFTCHKAQGSEWDRVLVYPPGAGSPAEMRRWCYTAFTRARRMLALAYAG
jgi:exodeoxyribonuclease V